MATRTPCMRWKNVMSHTYLCCTLRHPHMFQPCIRIARHSLVHAHTATRRLTNAAGHVEHIHFLKGGISSVRVISQRYGSKSSANVENQMSDDLNYEHFTSQNTTHFGFKTVQESEKVEKVYEVFKNVAEKYDLMNDVMSMGIHRLWKDEFVRHLSPYHGMKLLDVAGGTGDIAFRYMKYGSNNDESASDTDMGDIIAGRQVTICDINEHMLKVGEQRAVQLGLAKGVTWLQGNAEELPIEDNAYDAYTIAFGIRNCTHVKKVLSEAYRVLKPGGRFLCLEFSEVRNPMLRAVYDQYSFQVIPVMGHVIAQDWNSYQYLVESIRKFPNQETFASWIEEAGFSSVTCTDMTFGAVAIHSGFKL